MTADSAEQLPTRLKFLYSLGDLSTSMPLTVITFYQLFFLTDVAGLSPALAGTSVAVGRLWDSINDPLFAILSDRIRHRWGRRRVVILFGTLPLGLTFILQFLVPPFSETGLAIYYALAFILFDTTYTAVHVSYNALTPELTRDYDERSSLNGYRMTFSIVGGLIAVIVATALGLVLDNQRTLFQILGLIVGLVVVIPMLIAFFVTADFDEPEGAPAEEQISAWEGIRATLGNRPFLLFMGLFLFSWTTVSLISTVLIFFANYYLNVPDQANFFILVTQVSAIAFVPFWVWVAQRLEKRSAFIAGCLSWLVVLLVLATIGSEQVLLAYILAGLSGAGVATAYFFPWAMIPDIVEFDELETGQRREGSFYAFASFLQKLGTGAAIWFFGIALSQFGYVTPDGTGALPVQPAEAITAIRWSMGLIPAILLAIAVICAYYYPITREKHATVRQKLASQGGD